MWLNSSLAAVSNIANALTLLCSTFASAASPCASPVSTGPRASSNRDDSCIDTSPSSAFVNGGSIDAVPFTCSARSRTSSRKVEQAVTAGIPWPGTALGIMASVRSR